MPKHKQHIKNFSWGEFLDFNENMPSGNTWRENQKNTSEKNAEDEWVMQQTGVTLHEAVEIARNGWEDGMEHVRELEGVIASHTSEHVHDVIETGIQGFMPNVPNYLSNVPDTMFYLEQTTHQKPIVKIVAHPCANWTTDKMEFIYYGVAVMCLVNTIEQQGLSCEVDMCYSIDGHDKTDITLNVELKKAGQPMDMDRIVMGLAHPATFRRMVFHYIEQDMFWDSHRMAHGRTSQKTPKSTADVFHIEILETLRKKITGIESYISHVEKSWNAYQNGDLT